MESKSQLRRHFRKLRAAVDPDRRWEVAHHLVPLARSLAHGCRVVALTRSVGSELPTDPFARDFLLHGVSLLWIEPDRSLDANREVWIATNVDDCSVEVNLTDVDLFLVPGLAFTLRGERLGQGGGFFDRLLSRRRPGALAVGLCFECQVADSLPTEMHDQRMDHVLHG
jgi:5,10-methenyltetrahydrofolate synthetase